MKISPSIAVKNGLAYMALMAIACFLLGYLLFKSSQKILIQKEFNQIESNLKLLQFEFKDYIQDIQNDVLLLKDESERICQTQVNWKDGKSGIVSLFEYLMEKEGDYAQIRILLSQGKGKEWVRVDRKENHLVRVHEDSLQVKGDRDYFISTMALDSGEIYFSPIDLNKEYGRISWPKTPTLRAATPWFVKGEKRGILIINLDLRSFFEQLKSYADQNQTLYLFSSQGDYLLHPDSTMIFGFEFGQPGLAQDFLYQLDIKEKPVALEINNTLTYLFTDTWAYPAIDYYVILGLSVDENSILAPVYLWRDKVVNWVLAIVLLAGLIGFILMQNQRNRIQRITHLMQYPLSSEQRKLLPTNRSDEIGDLAKSFSGMLGEIDQRVQEVRQERELAIKATREKEVFIENMSHELRNPLQNIMGMQDVLSKNEPREDQLPIINSMKFSAKQLKRLVDDVLDYAKIKEGHILLKKESVDLVAHIEQLVKSFQHQANLKGQELAFDYPRELFGKHFEIDPTRLSQVLGNLMSNAIKYTPEKGNVLIQLIKLSEGIRFSIEDSGPGIPEDIQHDITERFVRGKDVGSSHISGAGLGLSISVELLALMGTELVIKGRKPKGTSCSFVLPIVDDAREPTTTPQEQKVKYWPGLRSVLIIDDDQQIQLWYQYLFENVVDECFIRSQFQEMNQSVDLIIADVNLSQDIMTPELLMPQLSEKGILIFSSGELHQSYEDHIFLRKPVEQQDVFEAWCLHWKNYHLSELTLEKMRRDYDDNLEILHRVFKVLLDQWKEMTEQILSSIEREDEENYRKVLHKLTTTLKTLGLVQMDSELHDLPDHWLNQSSKEVAQAYRKLFWSIRNQIELLISSTY